MTRLDALLLELVPTRPDPAPPRGPWTDEDRYPPKEPRDQHHAQPVQHEQGYPLKGHSCVCERLSYRAGPWSPSDA